MAQKERRAAQRFSLKLPLKVRWTTEAGGRDVTTESLNVSSRGVYFYLSKEIRKGAPLEIVMTLPHEITMAGPVQVRCLGHVQRTEPADGQKIGVVAAIERFEFVRGSKEDA